MSTTEATLQRVIELLRDLDTSSDTTFEDLKESLDELKSDLPLASDVSTTSGSLSDEEERPEDRESVLEQRISVLENAVNNIDPSLNPEADYLSEDPGLQFGEVKVIVAFDDNNFPSPYVEVLPQSPSFEGTPESANQEMLVPRVGKRMKPMLRLGDVVSYRTDYEQRKILVGPYQYSENTHWAQACADWTNVGGGFDNESYVDCLPAVSRSGSSWQGPASDPPGAPAVGDLYVVSPTGAWVGHYGDYATWDAVGVGWEYQPTLTTLTTPPGAPAAFDTYGIGSGATGAWAGHDGEYATWDAVGVTWDFQVTLTDAGDPPGAPPAFETYRVTATGVWANREGFFALWTDNYGDGGSWEFTFPNYVAGVPAAKGDWALRVFLPRPGLGGGATTGDPNVREDAVIAYTWVPTTVTNAQQYNASVDEFEVPVCVSSYMDAPIGTIWAIDNRGGAGPLIPPGWEDITANGAGLDARDRAILAVGAGIPYTFGANNNIFDPVGAGDGFAFHWIRRIN